MEFAPQCPRCGSQDVKLVGSHDHYPPEASRINTPPLPRSKHFLPVNARFLIWSFTALPTKKSPTA